MASLLNLPLVRVKWIDHTSVTGWVSPEDALCYKTCCSVSYGKVLLKDKNRVILTSMIDPEFNIVGNREYIPAGWVVKIERIKEDA